MKRPGKSLGKSLGQCVGLIAALLIGSAISARADTDIWTNVLKQKRGDDALKIDGSFCDAQLGAPKNGTPTSAEYKRCMRARGWRFNYTRHEKDDRYPDPDNPGMMCRSFKIGGITGSDCSNY